MNTIHTRVTGGPYDGEFWTSHEVPSDGQAKEVGGAIYVYALLKGWTFTGYAPVKPHASWEDVVGCVSSDCVSLVSIRDYCVGFEEPLFVLDCRMHPGAEWMVVDIRRVFLEPASVAGPFAELEAAIAFVHRSQACAPVYFSSFPLRPFTWGATFARRKEEVHHDV
jgi:hypothetical protein